MSEMIDRLRAQVDQHEGRLDDHLRRLGVLEAEAERTRKRLHRMENDRRAVQALVRTTQTLAEQTGDLGKQVAAAVESQEQIADRAAEKALAKDRDRRAASRWRLVGRLAAVGAGLGGLGAFIAYIVHAL